MRYRQLSPTDYVELRARSAFSFLRGASLPEDLATQAAKLGYAAMALGDDGGLYGAPRFLEAARDQGVRPLVAADLQVEDLGNVRLLVESTEGYRNLCRLFTQAHSNIAKGEHRATLSQLADHAGGLFFLLGHLRDAQAIAQIATKLDRGRTFAEIQRHLDPAQERRNRAQRAVAGQLGMRVVATNDVRFAERREHRLFDVLTCIREKLTLETAGTRLARNRERCLQPPQVIIERFSDLPECIAATRELAERCTFTLDKLPYELPDFRLDPGETPMGRLTALVDRGLRHRIPQRAVTDTWLLAQVAKELRVFEERNLAGYFLVVWDLVRYCQEKNILVQGRGSAANSAVCYALGITNVPPQQGHLFFDRFLAEERTNEWPDVDLDLPSGGGREEVIQYVYQRYGPRGAAMCAEVICYRQKLALREVGKVLGIPDAVLDSLSRHSGHFADPHRAWEPAQRLEHAGLAPKADRLRLLLELSDQLVGLPRHLSQHSGGMIIAKGHLDEMVPLEPATMPQRTVLQWDKHDIESLGLIKIDLLGLGMMAALSDARTMIASQGGRFELHELGDSDPKVYRAARDADTVGVFQIESRAQMSMLPRLQPKEFYDLVIAVSIVRPGPIVGKLVNPYLQRRMGRAPVTYPVPELEEDLQHTLGVPLFQEQLMKLAMKAAGLTSAQAQELRRVMSRAHTQKRAALRMKQLEEQMRATMLGKGLAPEAAQRVLDAIGGFAEYGFPESHAASFALLVYASLHLKVHHPAVFLAVLLNNQPMGFYSAATLVKDAQRHGVHVRTPCVVRSEVRAWATDEREVRLGLRSVRGLSEKTAQVLVAARNQRPFQGVTDAVMRAGLTRRQAEALAQAGAFAELGVTRRSALWEAHGALRAGGLAPAPTPSPSPLPELSSAGRTFADYSATGLTVGPHLIAHLRGYLRTRGAVPAEQVKDLADGMRIRIAGLVITRQRPGTANGMVFVTLEDETGLANALVDPEVFDRYRSAWLDYGLLLIEGILQSRDGVAMVKARSAEGIPVPERALPSSHDFH